MSHFLRIVSLWAPVLLYLAGIYLVSADPSPPAPAAVSDKVLHAGAYFGLALLAFRAVAGGARAPFTWRAAALAVLLAAGYGITDEVHQRFVPGRSPDVLDAVADTIGAVIAVGVVWAWHIISRRTLHGASAPRAAE